MGNGKHGLGVLGLKNQVMKVFQKMEFLMGTRTDSPGSSATKYLGITYAI